jgi:hypothetical protein
VSPVEEFIHLSQILLLSFTKLDDRKPCMPKEPEDETGTLAESRKAAIHLSAELTHTGRRGVSGDGV